ncbi:MAG: hypothetical protein CJBNEKGG_04262 [Prosthecobacter sp.]|nr:hypothetical protein [Prosthecobacter sp.]
MSDSTVTQVIPNAASPPAYVNPPVIERVVTLHAPMTAEVFEANIERWKQKVTPEYPAEEPLIEWLVEMEEKDGVPLFDTLAPKLRITHRFSKKTKAEGFDWSIRCPVGKFTMNMHSHPGSGRRYDHLRKEFAKWLPQWMEHFGVERAELLNLGYINVLRRDVTPQFFNKDGGLELDKVLRVFSEIPGKHESLEPPYDCRVTVNLGNAPARKLSIRVKDATTPANGVAIKVTLETLAQVSGEGGISEVLELLDWSHERIIERFEQVFTDEAKASFTPEAQ